MHLPPTYEPPYESPLEDEFAWHLIKYLRDDVVLEKQVSVDTICGTFRVDFVATRPSQFRAGLECDGADFHDRARDEWRDAMILGAGVVDSMARVRGRDFTYHPHDVLVVLARWYPQIFSEKGLRNLEKLAAPEIASHAKPDSYREIIGYEASFDGNGRHMQGFYIDVERWEHRLGNRRGSFSKHIFDFARAQGGGSLDEIIGAYRST